MLKLIENGVSRSAHGQRRGIGPANAGMGHWPAADAVTLPRAIVGIRLAKVRARVWPIGYILVGVLIASASSLFADPEWQANLSKEPPGNFPLLRPLRGKYVFGWSGFTAATAEVYFARPDDRCQVEGSGRTVGLARALWRYDVTYRASAIASTLRPIESNQADGYRSKKITTHLVFNNAGVRRSRSETPTPSGGQPKSKDWQFPNLFDLQTSVLYLRSQPLQPKSVYRLVVYPATNAYLATATVLGREKISVRAGSYNAVKIDLQLKKIGKDLDLQPHRKFRRATIWVSDDSDRVVLRIEAQVFVGTVFAELQSVRFEEPRP